MRLVENLFCYVWSGSGNNCHTYLFKDVLRGDRPHVIIDPGHVVNESRAKCLETLMASMQKDGVKPEAIGLIVNTHSHLDHCEANTALAYMSVGNRANGDKALIALNSLEDEYRRTIGKQLHNMLGLSVEFEPDFYLEEGDLNLGQGEGRLHLQIMHTPGHSPGSISIYWPQNKVLITGDVVFNGSVGRTDFPGCDSKALKQSIEKLSELDVDYLLPGHSTEFGNMITSKEKVVQNFTFIRLNYFPLL